MERIAHELVQGSPEWDLFRLEHDGASEAAPMLGLSKNTTRSELLRMKSTGLPKEFSDWVQANILDHGHEVEALVRPMVEAIIGDELYPVTYSYGKLSASCDGLTMSGEIAFECKQWNAALAESVSQGILPDEHQPQCQQVMLVTGAERLIFAVSDGGALFTHMEVMPDKAWQDRIIAGWKQFHEDLANYVPPEPPPEVTAAPKMSLPALSIQVNGSITLIDNLKIFGAKLTEFVADLDMKPADDQGFADAEAAIKTLTTAQTALEAAEASALAQTASIDEMRRTVALYVETARTTRLALEKMVKQRKEAIRGEIVALGKQAFTDHIARLNARLGRPYMPVVPVDFVGVIKGKKTVASLRDAVDTELARAKIAANEIADRIQVNLTVLREEAKNYAFLFSDTATIVLKAPDDFAVLVGARIAKHVADKAKEEEETRERIRKEEEAKAAAAHQKKLDDEAVRIKAEQEAAQKAAEQKPEGDLPKSREAVRTASGASGGAVSPAPNTTGAARSYESINGTASLATATAAPSSTPVQQGIHKLLQLIDGELAYLTAGELQQALDAIRAIRAAKKRNAVAA